MATPGIRRFFHLERSSRRLDAEVDDELRFRFDMTLRDLLARGLYCSRCHRAIRSCSAGSP